MIKGFGFLALLAVFVLAPRPVEARGYGRGGGMVNTPFGSFRMNSPEYRMAGGNPFLAQQIRQERMMMQYQMQMMKQQQRYMQQAEKMRKSNPNAFKSPAPKARVHSRKTSRRALTPSTTRARATIPSEKIADTP